MNTNKTEDRYVHAEKVLPPALVKQCQDALDGHRAVVTFDRILYSPLNNDEQRLGGVLAHQCRQHLFGKDMRQVYFPGARTRLKLTRAGAAQELLNQGHDAQAVADAIGVSRRTLYDWNCKSKRDRGAGGHALEYELSEDADTLLAGILIVVGRIKKRPPRIDNLSNEEALAKLAQALDSDVDSVRRRAYAAAHAEDALNEIDLED